MNPVLTLSPVNGWSSLLAISSTVYEALQNKYIRFLITSIFQEVCIPSSMHVMPSDHISTRSSYCPFSMARITSGAIQYGVPTNVFAGHDIDAEPKSATTNSNTL